MDVAPNDYGSDILRISWTPAQKLAIWQESDKTGSVQNGATFTIGQLTAQNSEWKELYAEGTETSNGVRDIDLTLEYLHEDEVLHTDLIKTTVLYHVDLDVDSDNDDALNPPERDANEDQIEDIGDDPQHPGKFVCVNDGDEDGDGIPGFADGFDWDGSAGNEDDASPQDHFVPLVLELSVPVDPPAATLRVTYDASPPGDVSRTGSGTPGDPYLYWLPQDGRLRVWRKDGSESRDKQSANHETSPGDYVAPGDYEPPQLGLSETNQTVTLYVEGVRASSGLADERIRVEVDPDGDGPTGYMNEDAVRATVVKIGWDDAIPDYSLDDDEDSASDSDNYFLRQGDDAALHMYWDILPASLEPSSVAINIYEENAGSPIILDAEDGVPQTAGTNKHVEWDARSDGQYRETGYYRVELVVQVGSFECKTPIDDADMEHPGWQCPQKGLGIHDLVWKHRPVVHMGDAEEVAPNGPCYPFDDGVIGHGSQDAPNYRLREQGSEAWSTEPNYSEWGEFPLAAADLGDESYRYPVLQASAAHSPTTDHAIDMLGQDEGFWTGNEPIIQQAVPPRLGYRGIPEPAGTNNHLFIHWWMYETASYAPYGAPGSFVHDADWEMLQLCIELRRPGNPDSKAHWLKPWAATASQHYYGQTLAWRRDKQGATGGTLGGLDKVNHRYVLHADASGDRFNIYVAENAHATYFQSGEIDVDVTAETGTQCQYDNDPESAYDACQTPLVALHQYPLIALIGKGGAGIYDWEGKWGTHHDVPGYFIKGPALREADPNIVIANDPVTFHNRCRKHVDASGDFDPSGDDDPETELRQISSP